MSSGKTPMMMKPAFVTTLSFVRPYQPSPPSCPASEAQSRGGEQEGGEDRQDAGACHPCSVPERTASRSCASTVPSAATPWTPRCSRALLDALDELAADDELRVARVLDDERARAVRRAPTSPRSSTPTGGVARMELFTRMYAAVDAFPLPTIAVCVGNVVGAGAELAAGCDLRVGGDNLKLAWAGREARRAGRPGAARAAHRALAREGAHLHRPRRRDGGGRAASGCCTARRRPPRPRPPRSTLAARGRRAPGRRPAAAQDDVPRARATASGGSRTRTSCSRLPARGRGAARAG